jgi:hypothetical protein
MNPWSQTYTIDVHMNIDRVCDAGLGQLADVCGPALRQHVAPRSTKEHAVLASAQSGATVFTACLALFRDYPLAVRRHYAEHRYGSMVMMNRDGGAARFFVLIMERDDLFAIRPWDRRDWARVEIHPREPVDDSVRRLISSSVPMLRDGALLGWVAGQQVRAVLAAHGRLPEPWDDASVVPGALVMPRVGTLPAERPPLTGRPLDDERLWEYVARGQLTDLTPLISGQPRRVFWVPGVDEVGGRRVGRLVVTERLQSDDAWLPAGVYADRWAPREESAPLTASQLLALPGVTDLSRSCERRQLLGV